MLDLRSTAILNAYIRLTDKLSWNLLVLAQRGRPGCDFQGPADDARQRGPVSRDSKDSETNGKVKYKVRERYIYCIV